MAVRAALLLLPSCVAIAIEWDARRLILVRQPAAVDAAAVVAHVSDTHGDDIRYMMTADSEDAKRLLQSLAESVQPKTLGRLATSQSKSLLEVAPDELVDDAYSRAVDTRDYILRGTLEGGCSVIIAHESIVELLLLRAADLESAAEDFVRGVVSVPAVSVLDFGPGSFPWMVADQRPAVQPSWQPDS